MTMRSILLCAVLIVVVSLVECDHLFNPDADCPCLFDKPKNREQCYAYDGSDEATCLHKGCCFEQWDYGEVWCYEPRPVSKYPDWVRSDAVGSGNWFTGYDHKDCVWGLLMEKTRVNCGWKGITEEECNCRGCCFCEENNDQFNCWQLEAPNAVPI